MKALSPSLQPALPNPGKPKKKREKNKNEENACLAVAKPVEKYFFCYLFISILLDQWKGYQNS